MSVKPEDEKTEEEKMESLSALPPGQMLITHAQFASMVKRKPETIYEWRANGLGPKFVATPEGRFVGYRPEAVDEWFKANQVQSPAEARERAREGSQPPKRPRRRSQ